MNVCCVKTEDLDEKIVKTTGSFLLPFENVFKNKKIYWIERSQAETDENYKQLIPYIMMTDGHGRFACYLRHGNEKRLHGLYSCGIGGHIDEVDKAGTIMETVKNGMYRELSEELKNFQKEKISLEYRGIINEVKTKVGLVHIGLVFFARCLEGYLPEPADELAGLEWKSIDEIKKLKKEFWSDLALGLI